MSKRAATVPSVICALAALALVGGTASSSHGASPGAAASPKAPITIAFAVPGPAPYITSYINRLKQLAKANGVKLIQTLGNWTPQKQSDQIDTMIAQRPDVFLVWPVDATTIVPILARIKAAGIKMVGTNQFPGEIAMAKYIEGFTGYDDISAAQVAARTIVKVIGTKTGEIAMIRGTAGTPSNIRRAQGFRDELKKIAPGIKIVADQDSVWGDSKKTYDITTAILRKHPNILAIMSEDGGMFAVGLTQAIADLGLKTKVVAFDGSCRDMPLIKRGRLTAGIAESAWTDAEFAFKAVLAVAKGQSIAKVTFIQPVVVTRANVSKYVCRW